MRTIAPLLLLVGAASAFTTNAARHATPRVAASVRMGLIESAVAALPTTEPIKQALAAFPLPEELVTGLAVAPYAAVAALVARTAFERLLVPVLCSSGSAEQEGSLKSQQYTRGRKLGGGNYGAVYEGFKGDEDEPSVVIKETSSKAELVDGTLANFGLSELYMNQKLMLCGQGGNIAKFQGHYYYGGDLCMVYQREGEITMADALKGKDFPYNVEEALTGKESGEESVELQAKLIRKMTGQVFGALDGIHSWSVVHRDVKGANLVLSEREKRFKLIDFGAACDTASGTNYDPRIQVFDKEFGPPEADLYKATNGQEGGFVVGAGGKFDVYCAGLLVLQMCFPPLRGPNGVKRFKAAIVNYDYDLAAWRESVEGTKGYAEGVEILDKNGGWKLLAGCLKESPGQRISSSAAASSGFCRA